MFLTEDEVLMGQNTDKNISARSLTLLIFTVGWAFSVWSTTTRTQVSMMPLPSL